MEDERPEDAQKARVQDLLREGWSFGTSPKKFTFLNRQRNDGARQEVSHVPPLRMWDKQNVKK